jgi:hypothetical protein
MAKKLTASVPADLILAVRNAEGDPRGAALFILRPGDVPEGEAAESYYSRGMAVY